MSAAPPFTCSEVFRRLDDYLDRRLDAPERAAVERHLEHCLACAREYTFETRLVAELRARLTRLELPPGWAERFLSRLSVPADRGPRNF